MQASAATRTRTFITSRYRLILIALAAFALIVSATATIIDRSGNDAGVVEAARPRSISPYTTDYPRFMEMNDLPEAPPVTSISWYRFLEANQQPDATPADRLDNRLFDINVLPGGDLPPDANGRPGPY
jgi:hypothetical protein